MDYGRWTRHGGTHPRGQEAGRYGVRSPPYIQYISCPSRLGTFWRYELYENGALRSLLAYFPCRFVTEYQVHAPCAELTARSSVDQVNLGEEKKSSFQSRTKYLGNTPCIPCPAPWTLEAASTDCSSSSSMTSSPNRSSRSSQIDGL